MRNLSQIQLQETSIIEDVIEHPLKTKLLEMGFRKGKTVKLIKTAPFGDPIIVELSGYKLIIRKEEAKLIKLAS
jgi:Fe2+ transport system protein FeoA